MATTGTQIIQEARPLLNDETTDFTYSDANMLKYINQCLRRIAARRPDSLVAADGTRTTATELSAVGSSIPFADKWRIAFVHYCVAQCVGTKADGKENRALSKYHNDMFLMYLETL